MPHRAIRDWTVEYGDGPQPCTVPHAWRQDVDVRWEGPAVYATTVEVPAKGGWLVFDGVSYASRIFLNGELALEHFGIWDAFAVSLKGFEGKSVEVRVEVVKNGGSTYPVKEVLSGFLPYVFNTFGGIWRDVWICEELPDLEAKAPPCRVTVKSTKIFVDKKPSYLRGVLTWGWYPELGHPNPSDEEIRREVRIAKELGFNTIKFCLWVPSHRYFEILEEEGMFAWLELPLWDPSPDPALQEKMFAEMERIVRQYRHHSNIVVWTCGCELSSNTTAEFRKRLYEMVKEHTGAALVKDNSGSSEMYGGDLREYGDFYDFHPYCDLPFYPVVLDSLLIGPREKKPILLGEFNDIDVHRDIARIKKEQPYWASKEPYLNDQGVRWEPPQLPRILEECRFANGDISPHKDYRKWESESKAGFTRLSVQEAVRMRGDIAGYVITGWRDTPISSSGVIDDWNEPRTGIGTSHWNSEGLLFLIPYRQPPWVRGGNRIAYRDAHCHFIGDLNFRIGGHSLKAKRANLEWDFRDERSHCLHRGKQSDCELEALEPAVLEQIQLVGVAPGRYLLFAQHGLVKNVWPVSVFERPDFSRLAAWGKHDPQGHLEGALLQGGPNMVASDWSGELLKNVEQGNSLVAILTAECIVSAPFWRECMWCFWHRETPPPLYFNHEIPSVSGDCVIDMDGLAATAPGLSGVETIMSRIDTRTYAEAPILIRAKVGKGTLVATTLRPFGGLGAQPYGVMNNPAGAHLLEKLIELAEDK